MKGLTMKFFTRFFKSKFSVCKECGVHFEPVIGYESKWGYLCSVHRKPVKERDEKKDRVMHWASLNWERLSDQMEKENKELTEQEKIMYEKYMLGLQNMAMNVKRGI